jgi:type IV pilus assembly protein PilN
VKITLNLATRPFVDVGPAMKRLRIAMIALAVFSLAAFGALHQIHSLAEAARATEHSLDGKIARINAERTGYESMMAQPKNAEFMGDVDELNTLIGDKSFSWTMAMESLETELPGGVQVTQIEPLRSKTGHITLRLRVVGPHDLSDQLVKHLEQSKRFQSPRIVGEEAESANSQNQRNIEPPAVTNRFNFDLQTEYVPPSEDELAAEKKREKAAKTETEMQEAAPTVATQRALPTPAMPNPVTQNGGAPYRGPGANGARGRFPGVVPPPAPPQSQKQRKPYSGGPQ